MPVIFRGGIPIAVPTQYRRGGAYRTRRRQCDHATSYEAVIALVEQAVHEPAAYLAADFVPQAKWAQRFLATTACALVRPAGDPNRRLAERALTALVALLTGVSSKPGPKRRQPTNEVARVAACYQAWERLLSPPWVDQRGLQVTIVGLAARRFTWSAAHHRSLAKAFRRPRVRRDRLLRMLVGWELKLSARQVETALRPVHADILQA